MERFTSDDMQNQDSYTHSSDTTSTGQRNEREQRVTGAEDLPSVYIGTPHPFPVISSRFCMSLRNMFVPFPDHMWEPVGARFIPDARNAIVNNAIHGGFDYTMMIDADQWFPWNFFLELYEGIKTHGENTIVTGWSICKSGMFERQPSIFVVDDETGGVRSVTEAEIQTSERYFEVDSFGTCGFLAPTSVFRKLEPPYFADLNAIHSDQRVAGLYVGTQFAVGQDILFVNRLKEAGVKVLVARDARMPHEVVTSI